jgi:DNA polymerase-4
VFVNSCKKDYSNKFVKAPVFTKKMQKNCKLQTYIRFGSVHVMQKWIMHIDMDAFFASIEQLDHPEWRGRPLVVGGGDRGVVAAASYEVRRFGVHSAMPVFKARQLCPQAIFTPGRRWRYVEVSRQIMQVLGQFSPTVEQASIDEAYIDAAGLTRLFGEISELGLRIKQAVKEATGLSCSVGAAPVKFLAKIASDLNKPDGLSILYPEQIPDFLQKLPLQRIPGLGAETLKKIQTLGLRTAGDAQKFSEDFWSARFGKAGKIIHARCRGLDERSVVPYNAPKSESAENTFATDTDNLEDLNGWLLRQAERLGASLRKNNYSGRTITLKIKYADFTQLTRSHTLREATSSTRIIYETGAALLAKIRLKLKLRLIGLGVSNLNLPSADASALTAGAALLNLPGIEMTKENDAFLPADLDIKKEKALDQALDKARHKFGVDAVVRGKIWEKKNER